MAVAAHIDDKLAKKIASTLRLIVSDRPGEAAAALHALARILQGAGSDAVHLVAERIERGAVTADPWEVTNGRPV